MQAEQEMRAVLDRVPSGLFVITAAHDGKRSGVLVKSVQICSDEPVLVSVAVRKGHSIEPLIRDSRVFAVCLVDPTDRLIRQKFDPNADCDPEERTDPFDAIPVTTLATGSPIPVRSIMAIDCEVVRHFDLEADHELYVGLVRAARQYNRFSAGAANGAA
ncbi:MAG: flavin reductase [Phycisphaeraceae bacterium]|nr:flavin reductase [Phycisphaeraceae bacterium]